MMWTRFGAGRFALDETSNLHSAYFQFPNRDIRPGCTPSIFSPTCNQSPKRNLIKIYSHIRCRWTGRQKITHDYMLNFSQGQKKNGGMSKTILTILRLKNPCRTSGNDDKFMKCRHNSTETHRVDR